MTHVYSGWSSNSEDCKTVRGSPDVYLKVWWTVVILQFAISQIQLLYHEFSLRLYFISQTFYLLAWLHQQGERQEHWPVPALRVRKQVQGDTEQIAQLLHDDSAQVHPTPNKRRSSRYNKLLLAALLSYSTSICLATIAWVKNLRYLLSSWSVRFRQGIDDRFQEMARRRREAAEGVHPWQEEEDKASWWVLYILK
jgi:hypothetical protein